MSELSQYYENYAKVSSRWASPKSSECGCRGRGFWVSELDTVHTCPYHYVGQPHPEEDITANSIHFLVKGDTKLCYEVYGEAVLVSNSKADVSRWYKRQDARKHYRTARKYGYKRG